MVVFEVVYFSIDHYEHVHQVLPENDRNYALKMVENVANN
jgi:hypothetical protein